MTIRANERGEGKGMNNEILRSGGRGYIRGRFWRGTWTDGGG